MSFFRESSSLLQQLQSQREGRKVVFTNGCFDILHVGHVHYLRQAKELGDILVVGLNADDSVARLKGPSRPIQQEDDRGQILSSLEMVDHVVLFTEDTPERLIEEVVPEVLVKGGDWPVDKIVGSTFVQSRGGSVQSLSFVEGHSSSSIIQKIIETT